MTHQPSIALLLLSSIAAPALQGPGLTRLLSPRVEIPMDLSTHTVALGVFFGDQGPFPFNLDTYAVTTACLDRRFARRMGFEKVGTTRNGDGSGATRTLDVVRIPELRLGDAIFEDVHALVDDYSFVGAPGGGAIDGLLGYHLFHDLLLELDYPKQRVVLRRGELRKDDQHVVSFAALRNRPDLPLEVGGRRFVVGIDSGAKSTISWPATHLERLKLTAPPVLAGRAKTVYSEAAFHSGVLAEPLFLANHRHDGLSVTFSTLFGQPLIGHQLLLGYSVTFDQRHGRVRFLRPCPGDADSAVAPGR